MWNLCCFLFTKMIDELLEDIKKIRNDLVAKNYPYQQLTNLIYKWEDIIREHKKSKDDSNDDR